MDVSKITAAAVRKPAKQALSFGNQTAFAALPVDTFQRRGVPTSPAATSSKFGPITDTFAKVSALIAARFAHVVQTTSARVNGIADKFQSVRLFH